MSKPKYGPDSKRVECRNCKEMIYRSSWGEHKWKHISGFYHCYQPPRTVAEPYLLPDETTSRQSTQAQEITH